ncbi:MAG: nucleotidyltransferase family protein [Bulleidia sp.]
MKTCGIICEYNPFHYGHQYQIEQARERSKADIMIGVMSGNFVQRGEPAVIDKWKRAEAAIRGGLDVVVELPLLFSIQAASHFAKGGVDLLKMCGCDAVSFGSECGNVENLQDIADTSVNPDHLRELMADGVSYPKAYSLLTSSMAPNDILGVCYLREIKDTGIEPVVIQRTGGYLDETMSSNASAMAIRKALRENTPLFHSTPMEETLQEYQMYMERLWPYIRTYLIMTPSSVLSQYFLFSEGIENHLKKHADGNDDYASFMSSATTWRYTASRIRRCLLTCALQITKQEAETMRSPQAVRVLAFNDQGRAWLHEIRDKDVRIASRFSDLPQSFRDMEYRACQLYTSTMEEPLRTRILKEEIRGARYIR